MYNIYIYTYTIHLSFVVKLRMVLYWVYRMIVIILGDMAINIAWLVLSNVRHFRFQMLGMSLII